MELKQLHFFVVCAKTQSFSRAASVLFTAQSNVSKVIKSLEDELGAPLFERKQYGIELTERGKQVLDYANATLESAQKILNFSQQNIREELRISCNPSSWMAAAFCDYYREYGRKDIAYHVMSASTNDIIQRLMDDIDHLGFLYLMEEQLPDFQNRLSRSHLSFVKLKETKAMLYFGNENAMKAYQSEENSEEPLALVQGYEDEFTLSSFWQDNQEEDQPRRYLQAAVNTNSDYLMQELLKNTGLGNISSGYLTDESEKKSPYAISLFENGKKAVFGCVFRNDRNLSETPLHYLNFIRKRLK